VINYCCTTPLPSAGDGNFTNAPGFTDLANGDFRLQSNSPCINSGKNVYATTSTDMDGHLRIVGGTVDVGAFEFQSPGSIISYAWLQHYGFPTDGSVDFIDSDGDGVNNDQEFRAGTDPTNPLSLLRLLPPVRLGNLVMVTWLSGFGRSYNLEYATDLSAESCFVPLGMNIPGQIGTTSFVHSNGFAPLTVFYRVSVP
jgi:hypothetical protein